MSTSLPQMRRTWDGCEVKFPFDLDVVEDLKAAIPARERRWRPETKTWFVTRPYVEFVANLLLRRFGDLEEVLAFTEPESPHERRGRFRPDPSPIRPTDAAYRELYLQSNAPAAVIEAAYRALAKLNHPDRGGDDERMRAINLAYEALRKLEVA